MILPDPSKLPLIQWTIVAVQVATLIALIVYVVKTWQMASATERAAAASTATLQEMQQARLQGAAPRVLIYFELIDATLALLAIENMGETTAEDVLLSFVPPLESSHGPSSLLFLATPKVLPPRVKLVHAFDTWPDYFGKKLPLRYSVTTSYRRADTGEAITSKQTLDAGGFLNLHTFARKGMHDLVNRVERIENLIKQGVEVVQRTATHGRNLAELDTVPRAYEEEIVAAKVLWTLYKKSVAEPGVHPPEDAYFSLIRRHLVAAIRSTQFAQAEPVSLEDLSAAFLALSNHRLQYLSRDDEKRVRVENLLTRLFDGTAGASMEPPSP